MKASGADVQNGNATGNGSENAVNPTNTNTTNAPPSVPGWEEAKQQVANGQPPPGQSEMPAPPARPRRGRPPKRAYLSNGTRGAHDANARKADETASVSTPGSAGRARGQGRGGGRPRKSRGSARSGKRKRDDDDDEDGDSDSSDEVTPVATMTKSGRSIQKPTSFVPPPESPAPAKRKRPYNRRNPESAVCKICLRGNSPASNMIVFCDGCNTPYHQWCHKPPVGKAVVDDVDKEWFCSECESERAEPVPEADVESFVSAEGASSEEVRQSSSDQDRVLIMLQRQKYFSGLPQGLLITLLTKATTLRPDLPLFTPEFKAGIKGDGTASTNGHGSSSKAPPPPPKFTAPQPNQAEEGYDSDVHPSNYPRPGQGLMSTLPPEKDDLQWLVEDDDKHNVFTHIYQDNSKAQTAAPHPGPTTTGASGGDAQG